MDKIKALAIDGPAGAGKSTIARAVSQKLGWIYVDTGALFRAAALSLLEQGISPEDSAAVSAAAPKLRLDLSIADGVQHVFVDGRDVSGEIRREEIGKAASAFAREDAVRQRVLVIEREIAAREPVVMDGRDIGTVVLPNALAKVFLTASVEVRAKRRTAELREKGTEANFEEVKRDIAARDEQDKNRAVAPLRQAEDALLLDSSALTIAEVEQRILALVREQEAVYSYGAIIHNEEVVRDLTEKGVVVFEDEDAAAKVRALPEEAGTIILRSHGVGPEVYRLCEEKKLRIVDTACPFVNKIHRIVQTENRKGRRVLIVGDPKHPEVEGIRAWGRADTAVIRDEEEFLALQIQKDMPLSVVAQTTFRLPKFKMLVDKIRELGYDIACFNTICNATQERQAEAKKIASEVDAMIVIGGKNSSNTRKLVEICSAVCPHTFYVRTASELDPELLAPFQRIGITAGASTPKHIIEEVQAIVRAEF